MNIMNSADRDIGVDLEYGGTTSEEDGNRDPVSSNRQVKKSLNRVLGGLLRFNGSVEHEYGVNSSNNSAKFGEEAAGNVELLIDKSSGGEESEEQVALVEKKCLKEKRKKTNSWKPPKPPRPPKGPALDAVDMMLVKEISEVTMRKRERIERMKALKKMREAKASSSNSSLCAIVITLLFFLVIIFQGLFSRSSSGMGFQGSPEPAAATGEGLISVQFYRNLTADEGNGPGSTSLNLVEQISGSGPKEEESKASG